MQPPEKEGFFVVWGPPPETMTGHEFDPPQSPPPVELPEDQIEVREKALDEVPVA